MTSDIPEKIYKFGEFRFNVKNLILTYKDQVLNEENVNASQMPLKILSVLLQNDGVVTYDYIIEKVWGVDADRDSTNISPHITTLKKLFKQYEKDSDYIKTSSKVGYRFVGAVVEEERLSNNNQVILLPINEIESTEEINATNNKFSKNLEQSGHKITLENKENLKEISDWKNSYTLALLLIVFFITVGLGLLFMNLNFDKPQDQKSTVVQAPSDEEEIRQVVKESQEYETLEIYGNPQSFDKEKLKKYFVSEEQGGKEPQKISDAVKNLLQKGTRYGNESKLERFDFLSVKVFSPRDYAEVQTDESWYLPVYRNDGSRVLDKNVRIAGKRDYFLRKFNGRWLIEENSTPRVKPDSTQ